MLRALTKEMAPCHRVAWAFMVAFLAVGSAVSCCGTPTCEEGKQSKSGDGAPPCRQKDARKGEPVIELSVVRGLVKNGDYATAVIIGAQVAEQLKTFDAYHVLADAAIRAEKFREAEQAALMAVELSSKSAYVYGFASATRIVGMAQASLDHLSSGEIYLQTAARMLEMLNEAPSFLQPHDVYRAATSLPATRLLEGDILYKRRRLREAEDKMRVFRKEVSSGSIDKEYYLIWCYLKFGILYSAQKVYSQADFMLRQSLDLIEKVGGNSDAKQAVYLNLAFAARESARSGDEDLSSLEIKEKFQEALGYIRNAEASDAAPYDVHLQRGIVLYLLEDFASAEKELDIALKTANRESILWEINYYRGLVQEGLENIPAALKAYHSACHHVEVMMENAGEYSDEVAAEHCVAFFRSIGLHVQLKEYRQALDVLIRQDWFYTLSEDNLYNKKGSGQLPSAEQVLMDWRGRHLVVIVSDGERVWQLQVLDGAVSGRGLGSASYIDELARRLVRTPGNEEAATELGALVLPPSSREGEVLEILTLGTMAEVPLSALRRGRELAIKRTPLARVLSLRSPKMGRRSLGPAVVMGDFDEGLEAARKEAVLVAGQLGVAAFLDGEATPEVLFLAKDAELLYVAAHVETSFLWGPHFVFGKEIVNARQIRKRGLSPDIVVLSSCIGADADDEAKRDSLAGAFLASGSRAVVAASRTVGDAVTLQLMQKLNLKLLKTDPAQALAKAQLAAAEDKMSIADWAAFTVLFSPP